MKNIIGMAMQETTIEMGNEFGKISEFSQIIANGAASRPVP
jgi:hypothetical protein